MLLLQPFFSLRCIPALIAGSLPDSPRHSAHACDNIKNMAATNNKGNGKAIFKAILPFLALLIVLVFVFFLWHYYHPNRKINLHQTHVSQLLHQPLSVVSGSASTAYRS